MFKISYFRVLEQRTFNSKHIFGMQYVLKIMALDSHLKLLVESFSPGYFIHERTFPKPVKNSLLYLFELKFKINITCIIQK